MQTFRKLLYLLTTHERKYAALLLCMILIMALLDMIGVASIMPFMAVLINPMLLETNSFLNSTFIAMGAFGIETKQEFLFMLGILVFILLIVSLTFKALTTYTQHRFTVMREHSIAKRLIQEYLQQSYSWFLNRHSADLGKTILSEVSNIIGNGFNPMINLIAQGTITTALLILLFFFEPKITLLVFFTLAIAYLLVYKFSSTILARIGQDSVKANEKRFTVVSETFGSIKEIKFGGLEKSFIQRFEMPAKNFAQNQALLLTIGHLPRFAMEAIAFGGMLLVVLYLMTQGVSLSNKLPLIALYVFAGYRLMPALQQIYGAITQLRFVETSLEKIFNESKSLQAESHHQELNPLPFTQMITLNHIYYNYPNSSRTALKNINLKIPVRSTVGIMGATGSGKTTMVDIILSLLEAQKGTLEVDGRVINKHNYRAWQRLIGYVPQQIYLADDTVIANIAFGIDAKDIDKKALEYAAKVANLHDFVVNELPNQYQTTVGERGVRLSGGQRQRIGIARALYKKPKLLILDEATSALDNHTEQVVMEAVRNLRHDITIIIIAHRLITLKESDIIFFMENGEIKGRGKYKELITSNEIFRKITGTIT